MLSTIWTRNSVSTSAVVPTMLYTATHQTVNHRIGFVEPTTGAHTNTFESYWHHLKVRRGTSTNWPNTCSRRGARPITSTPSPCSSTSSRALIGTFKRYNLHLPRLMPPSHERTCASVTILLLITLHAKPTDYIRGADDLLRTTPYLVSQLKLFPIYFITLSAIIEINSSQVWKER